MQLFGSTLLARTFSTYCSGDVHVAPRPRCFCCLGQRHFLPRPRSRFLDPAALGSVPATGASELEAAPVPKKPVDVVKPLPTAWTSASEGLGSRLLSLAVGSRVTPANHVRSGSLDWLRSSKFKHSFGTAARAPDVVGIRRLEEMPCPHFLKHRL